MGIENKRISAIYFFLAENGKVNNPRDFALKMKQDPSSLKKIMDGTRGVTPILKWKIYDTFHINKPYVFEGKGELDFEPAQETIDEKNELEKVKEANKSLKRSLKIMENAMKVQDIRIDDLTKQRDDLTKQLEEKNNSEQKQEKKVSKKTEQIRSKTLKSR